METRTLDQDSMFKKRADPDWVNDWCAIIQCQEKDGSRQEKSVNRADVLPIQGFIGFQSQGGIWGDLYSREGVEDETV